MLRLCTAFTVTVIVVFAVVVATAKIDFEGLPPAISKNSRCRRLVPGRREPTPMVTAVVTESGISGCHYAY